MNLPGAALAFGAAVLASLPAAAAAPTAADTLALTGRVVDDAQVLTPTDRAMLRLANRWGIGRKGINDGVMILVAPTERKTRIEVGLGIEAWLTDPVCQRIVSEQMVPRFARGDFAGGLKAGSAAVIAALP